MARRGRHSADRSRRPSLEAARCRSFGRSRLRMCIAERCEGRARARQGRARRPRAALSRSEQPGQATALAPVQSSRCSIGNRSSCRDARPNPQHQQGARRARPHRGTDGSAATTHPCRRPQLHRLGADVSPLTYGSGEADHPHTPPRGQGQPPRVDRRQDVRAGAVANRVDLEPSAPQQRSPARRPRFVARFE